METEHGITLYKGRKKINGLEISEWWVRKQIMLNSEPSRDYEFNLAIHEDKKNNKQLLKLVMNYSVDILHADNALTEHEHTRWWDYSDMPFNLDGYVCLGASALWGVLGVVAVKWGNPLLLALYGLLPHRLIAIILWAALVIFAIDAVGTLLAMLGLRYRWAAGAEIENRLANFTVNTGMALLGWVEQRMNKAHPALTFRRQRRAKSTTFAEGWNHLDGKSALAFARERHAFASGDIQRGINQMKVIDAMVNKLKSPTVLMSFSKLMDAVSDCFVTSLSQEQISALVRMQLSDLANWDIQSYSVTGSSGKSSQCYSAKGQSLYVMKPDESSVAQAKELIASVLGGEGIFQENGFVYAHSPLLTASDCEGAGEMFRVTTLDLENVPKNEDGTVDYTQDFFEKPVNLTVSGQLEAEAMAMAFGKVYTFGPTFRAETLNKCSRCGDEYRDAETAMLPSV